MLKSILAAASVAILLSGPVSAADDQVNEDLNFARSGFATLFSLPRPQNDLDRSYGLFQNAEAFAEFVKSSRSTPMSGISNSSGLSISYTFPKDYMFSINQDMPHNIRRYQFKALQQIKVGKRKSFNCFDVIADVTLRNVSDVQGYSFNKIDVKPAASASCAKVK